jgi:hypothetical protein
MRHFLSGLLRRLVARSRRCWFLVPELSGRAVRVNITLNEGLLARFDKAAGAEGETRSGYIAQAVRERLGR